GREYALADGEPEPVAEAIGEQYLPAGSEDKLPQTELGAIVAAAEKGVTLSAGFAAGLKPTSSSDPYGMRRAALGLLRIVLDREWEISISELLSADDRPELVEFIEQRFRHLLEEEYPTDIVNAVFAVGVDDIVGTRVRVGALTSLRREDPPDFKELVEVYKRAANIAPDVFPAEMHSHLPEVLKISVDEAASGRPVSCEELNHEVAVSLCRKLEEVTEEMQEAYDSRNWDKACRELQRLHDPLAEFFENVIVLTDNETARENRLNLLQEVVKLFHVVADFRKLEY
ncbi:MAG: glycine--tRNA ligase subunit beta, partial [Bradymonadaceae bacterium]